MRKTLTQTLLAAFCAILLAAPLEGGGVMLIGMRNAMLAGGGWENPYVTDGLIAMWDGEWNAGGGTHDATISKWKDLIGGLEFDNYGSGISFQSNCVRIADHNSYMRRDSALVKPLIQGDGASANFTIELCAAPVSDLASYNFARWITIGGNVTSYGYGVTAYAAEGKSLQYIYVKNKLFGMGHTSVDMLTVSFVSDGSSIKIFFNGVQKISNTNGSTTGWFDNWIIGGGHNNSMWAGDVYGHRVYSRALTAAEVAANYAVDKARFNLT